ncbi:hypothetical protein [Haladaptatus sp. DYF46]|uniref:hypothetical protein n=1 Tax=Haladaptatus sp. DYF46 TaxID=2886041 RepID=UPI001E2EE1F6|nr:hypothetical protein [Haladaptatus sp. DYF46]
MNIVQRPHGGFSLASAEQKARATVIRSAKAVAFTFRIAQFGSNEAIDFDNTNY